MESEELDYDETGLEVEEPAPSQPSTVPKKRKGERGISCPVCQLDCGRKLRRHAVRRHLPPFLAPSLTCLCCGHVGSPEESLDHHFRCMCPQSGPSVQLWVEQTRVFLERLRAAFNVPELDGLLEVYISRFGVPPYLGEGLEIGKMDKYLFVMLGQDPATLTLDPPNHHVTLCHWKLATRLLSLLSAEDRDQVLGEKGA